MSEIKVALVIGKTESDLEVVDLIGIAPLDATHYIIETPTFRNSSLLQNGAGATLEQSLPRIPSLTFQHSYYGQTHEPPILRDSIFRPPLDQTYEPFGGPHNKPTSGPSIDQPLAQPFDHSPVQSIQKTH